MDPIEDGADPMRAWVDWPRWAFPEFPKNNCTPVDFVPINGSNPRIRLDTCLFDQDAPGSFHGAQTMPHPIPAGYRAITPHLVVKGASEAIEFYKKAFGAEELSRMPFPNPDGTTKLGHAELEIGDSKIFLADEFPEYGSVGPGSSSPVTVHLYVNGTDADSSCWYQTLSLLETLTRLMHPRVGLGPALHHSWFHPVGPVSHSMRRDRS